MQINAKAETMPSGNNQIPASSTRIRNLYRSPLFDIILFIFLLLIMATFTAGRIENLGYNWQWYRIPAFILTTTEAGIRPGPLLQGLGITIKISAISMGFALLLGLAVALFRLSPSPVARLIARTYLEISRNTPLLIQLFFIYFVLGPVLGLERFTSAVLALSLFEGAYISEIFRSGIVSVNTGQQEAAASIGLNTFYTYRFIILPQAIRTILPPLTSQAISLIKDSALVSTIAIYDLSMQAQSLISETYLTFELWFTVALLYLVITITLSLIVTALEKRLKLP